ncbi:MAG: DUF438 domain-containing protein, partial [Chloroflexi bacterium]|nr:DUF438 domain-containing protein [Chloroflexota bacterium]
MDTLAERRKEAMKAIILELHRGLPAEQAKERFEKEVGNVTPSEIAGIEQALINEGMSPEEIKKFCNVHALIFRSALQSAASAETFPAHPVHLFKMENREVEKLLASLRSAVKVKTDFPGFESFRTSLKDMLSRLKAVETHYERKEQLLFPCLERKGFMGPSKVMWGKDNEIRALFRSALSGLDEMAAPGDFDAYASRALEPLLSEVEGMIFKEDNILFPTALEKLGPDDWVGILSESDDIGYVFIEAPHEADALVKEFRASLQEEPAFRDNAVSFPTGSLQLAQIMALLNTLPVDLTIIDKNDVVQYFSANKSRVFTRTKSAIGRKVQNCHPPQSLPLVEQILASFKEGKKDSYDFWIDHRGKKV